MNSYGYIIVDLCIIWFDLNCIMQLKQFYNIATKVSSRKKVLLFLVIYPTDDTQMARNRSALGNVLAPGASNRDNTVYLDRLQYHVDGSVDQRNSTP